jgi:hypothetical protein
MQELYVLKAKGCSTEEMPPQEQCPTLAAGGHCYVLFSVKLHMHHALAERESVSYMQCPWSSTGPSDSGFSIILFSMSASCASPESCSWPCTCSHLDQLKFGRPLDPFTCNCFCAVQYFPRAGSVPHPRAVLRSRRKSEPRHCTMDHPFWYCKHSWVSILQYISCFRSVETVACS